MIGLKQFLSVGMLIGLNACGAARTGGTLLDPDLLHPVYDASAPEVYDALRAISEGNGEWRFVSMDPTEGVVDLERHSPRTSLVDRVRIRVIPLEAGGVALMLNSKSKTRIEGFGGQRQNLLWLLEHLDQRMPRRINRR